MFRSAIPFISLLSSSMPFSNSLHPSLNDLTSPPENRIDTAYTRNAIVISGVAGFLALCTIAVQWKIKQDQKKVFWMLENLPRFRQLIGKIESFNALNSTISGMGASNASPPEALRTILDQSGIKKLQGDWDRLLEKAGLKLGFVHEDALDRNEEVRMHSKARLDFLENCTSLRPLLEAIKIDTTSDKSAIKSYRRLFVHLEELMERSILQRFIKEGIADQNYKLSKTEKDLPRAKEIYFINDFLTVGDLLKRCGRSSVADRINVLVGLYRTNSDACQRICLLDASLQNQTLMADTYWIQPDRISRAFAICQWLCMQAHKDPRLISYINDAVGLIDRSLSLLEFDASPTIPEDEESSSANEEDGGVAVLEETRPSPSMYDRYELVQVYAYRCTLNEIRKEIDDLAKGNLALHGAFFNCPM